VSGKFPVPDMAALKIDPKDVLWKDAAVTLAVSDLRGTRESLMLGLGRKENSTPARLPTSRFTPPA